MTRHQEITAAKAGGVSFYRMAAPLILVSAVLSVGAVFLGETVPGANRKRAEALGERDAFNNPYRTNFVFRTEDGRTLSANRVNALEREMSQVVVEARSMDGAMRVVHSANSAMWYPKEGWRLTDGYVRWLPQDGEETTFSFSAVRLRDLREPPEELLVTVKNPDEM